MTRHILMSQDSPPEHIFNVRNAEIPSQPTRPKTKVRREWRKLFHQRRCPDCDGKLSDVIAFKQLPIGYCATCEEEKAL